MGGLKIWNYMGSLYFTCFISNISEQKKEQIYDQSLCVRSVGRTYNYSPFDLAPWKYVSCIILGK